MVKRYQNTGSKPVHTGGGTLCMPGEVWITDLDMSAHPALREIKVKASKKKTTKKKAGKK